MFTKKPVVVEKRKPRRGDVVATPAPQRRVAPDNSIRVFHADDPRPPVVKQAAKTSFLQDQVDIWLGRLDRPNDKKVQREVARRQVGAEQADLATASVIPLPHHPNGEAYLIFARKGCFALLGKALRMIIAATKFGKRDAPKEPDYRMGINKYVKGLKP